METVEVVIKIPKEMHKALVQGSFGAKYNMYDLVGCVMNGILLPKGHGDLKDYDAIVSDYIRKMSVFMSEEERMDLFCTIVDEAEVVIKADKDGEDGR